MESFERKLIKDAAAKLYNPEMPYHNFEHAQGAAQRGMEIVDTCNDEGVPIDRDVVYFGLLFHDAGYHEDHRAKGFATKEEYSAALAERALLDGKYNAELIEKVKAVILSTHRDASFNTNEAKAVRAADLAGLASDYDSFLDANRKLKREAEILGGAPLSWSEWKQKTKRIVDFYLSQNIKLTSRYTDSDGGSRFHNRVRANLRRFLSESESTLEGDVR